MSNLNNLIDKLTSELPDSNKLKKDTKDILKNIFDLEKLHLDKSQPRLKDKIKNLINHAAEKRLNEENN
tara:strand:+ start:249 stop:455 length:207 start_codon:yes stop_codon:yes gene_type:complete